MVNSILDIWQPTLLIGNVGYKENRTLRSTRNMYTISEHHFCIFVAWSVACKNAFFCWCNQAYRTWRILDKYVGLLGKCKSVDCHKTELKVDVKAGIFFNEPQTDKVQNTIHKSGSIRKRSKSQWTEVSEYTQKTGSKFQTSIPKKTHHKCRKRVYIGDLWGEDNETQVQIISNQGILTWEVKVSAGKWRHGHWGCWEIESVAGRWQI